MTTPLVAVGDWLRTQPVELALAVLVAGSLAAAWLLTRVGLELARRAVRSTSTWIDDVLFDELRWPVTITVAVAGFWIAGTWLDVAPESAFYLRVSSVSVVVLVYARALIRLGDRVIEHLDEDSGVQDFAPIFENLWNFAILLVGLFALLSLWDVDVTPLLASAGIAGIAIGFAAKDTIANFFGSIALYVDDTYTVGDYVVLDSGEAGTVVDISIRSTRLLTRDDVVVTVPNSVLNSARIVNQSAPRGSTRVKIPVGVAYGSDLDEVEDLLLEVAADSDHVAGRPHPRVRFRRFGDSALEHELLVWVPTPMLDGRATHHLNRGIYEAFAEAGVEIPFPQRAVTLDGGSAGLPVAAPEGLDARGSDGA